MTGAFAFAFMAGAIATANPCGFALLPAYFARRLGTDAAGDGDKLDAVARAFAVGAVTTCGFLLVFGAAEPSLLAGLLHDERGNRLSPSHAVKNGVRYRYYVSQALHRRGAINVRDREGGRCDRAIRQPHHAPCLPRARHRRGHTRRVSTDGLGTGAAHEGHPRQLE